MTATMIELKEAAKTFTMHLQGGVRLPVISGASFQVAAGECVVLAGPAGIGKSSILKMIFGNYRCDAGRIAINHRGGSIDIAGAEPRQILDIRRHTIGYVSQFLRVVPRVPTVDVVASLFRVTWGYGAAVVYVFTTAMHTSALGALLTFSRTLWYPAYQGTTAAWGLTPVEDQQLGGLIMWVPAGVVYLAAGLLLFAL